MANDNSMDELLAQWPDGWMRCQVDSSTRRLALGDDDALPQPRTQEEPPEIHSAMMIDPRQMGAAKMDMRAEIERRLLFQLVEHGIKEHLWPIAPRFRWNVYDARMRHWYGMHWPPSPPVIRPLDTDYDPRKS